MGIFGEDYTYEPVDGEAAELIAGIAAKAAKKEESVDWSDSALQGEFRETIETAKRDGRISGDRPNDATAFVFELMDKLAAKASKTTVPRVCSNLRQCYGKCMMIVGNELDTALDADGKVDASVIVFCQENSRECDLHGDPWVKLPANLVRQSKTIDQTLKEVSDAQTHKEK